MVNYFSLISTSVHILHFEWLRESLQLISFFLNQVLVDKVPSCPAIHQGKGINDLRSFIHKDGDGSVNEFFHLGLI